MRIGKSIALVILLALAAAITMAAPRTQAPVEVRVGYLPATHDALLFIAKEMKLFNERRVSVELKSYDNSVQILSDLKSGLLDIGIPGVATPAAEIGGRAPLSIIGGAAAESAALVAQPELASAMARAPDWKAKVQLLRGKKVGAVRGSTGLAIFRQALVGANLTERGLDLRNFSKPAEVISALVAHDLDAGLLWSPHMTLAEGKGLPIAFWMKDVLPRHVCCRQVARDEYLKSEDAVVEYLAGLLRAEKVLRAARRDPKKRAQVLTAVRSYLTTLNDKEIDLELFSSSPRTTVTPDLDREGIRKYLEAMKVAGLMREDQCDNVEGKVRSDFMMKAYQKLGCSAQVAQACVNKPSHECECMRDA